MLVVNIFLISVVVAAVDENQNETAIALPVFRLPIDDYQTSSPTSTDLSDYQAFQRFKYLVYPHKFADTTNTNKNSPSIVGSAFARNITIDEIQLPTTQNNEQQMISEKTIFRRRSDYQQPLMEASSSLESRHYPLQDYHHDHPHNGPAVLMYGFGVPNQPNSFPSNGMANMGDPLFVMATLAFVAFLVNSILGLVDRLNLLPLVRTTTKRRGKLEPVVSYNRVIWPERRNGDQSEEGVEAFLRELETTIRAAFEHYEKCTADPNSCDNNPQNANPKN